MSYNNNSKNNNSKNNTSNNKKKTSKKLTTKQLQQLEEHKKHHTSQHISAMKRYMREGISFTAAHKKAQKEVGQ